MANTYVRLAALRPADTNEAELYAVAADEYIVASLHICNQSASDLSYSIAITDASGAAANEDWICYNFPIQGTYAHKRNISIGDGDTIRVKSSSADEISFVLTGLLIQ
jgi:hypothetical protein